MKIGVFSVVLGSMKLEQALDYLQPLGVQAIELGVGGYPGSSHCPVDDLLASGRKAKEFAHLFSSRGMLISSLSCHGNPLHPDKKIAAAHHEVFCKAVKLAARLDVDVVTTFSGCPGGGPGDQRPNWVTCAWPPDFQEILDYQWNHSAITYWTKAVDFMKRNGVTKVALEMHPGFLVYNPETLLKLRRAAGPFIGANFDPSHLFWQGIEPSAAVRALKGAIWHVHAKDLAINEWNSRRNGVLETKPSKDFSNRAWNFRTVGYGHSRMFWCDFISNLRMAGYDGALSIEHEDNLMMAREGLEKGIRFLQGIILE
jgi:sugar phosphate isomerase/epimerase